MRRRQQPIERPHRRPFFRVEVRDREFTFRVPRPSTFRRLQKQLQTLEPDDEGMDVDDIEQLQGCVIGAFWADGDLELECDPGDGLAVWGELYDEGLGPQVIKAIYLALLDVAGRMTTEEEVEAKVDFTWTRALETSVPSSSDGPISMTHGGTSD